MIRPCMATLSITACPHVHTQGLIAPSYCTGSAMNAWNSQIQDPNERSEVRCTSEVAQWDRVGSQADGGSHERVSRRVSSVPAMGHQPCFAILDCAHGPRRGSI